MARSTPAQKPRGWASTTLNIRVISSITPPPSVAAPAAERSLPIPATVRAARAMPRRGCTPSRILRLNNPAPILILAFADQFAITAAGDDGGNRHAAVTTRITACFVHVRGGPATGLRGVRGRAGPADRAVLLRPARGPEGV